MCCFKNKEGMSYVELFQSSPSFSPPFSELSIFFVIVFARFCSITINSHKHPAFMIQRFAFYENHYKILLILEYFLR